MYFKDDVWLNRFSYHVKCDRYNLEIRNYIMLNYQNISVDKNVLSYHRRQLGQYLTVLV